jgi:hypothetical protein
MNMYKIIYHNICGLDDSKLQFYNQLLLNSEKLVIILAEHWFSKNQELLSSPFFIASSLRPQNVRQGHQNGGLVIMSTSDIRQHIVLDEIGEYTISFYLEKKHIVSVYFPPRLNATMIQQLLLRYLNSDTSLLLGDINVRYGQTSRDKRTWNMDRGYIIHEVSTKMNLSHILCKEGCSGNDHVFSRETIEWDYLFLPKKHFRSDHGRIEIQITGKIDIVSEEKIARYAFSVLSNSKRHN